LKWLFWPWDTAYSGAQDFVLALLPWTIVWNLQMKRKEKLGVAFAMSLGILYVDPSTKQMFSAKSSQCRRCLDSENHLSSGAVC
jgi:hypothetical protein